ncbi:hypothetical protein ACQ4PT_017133 [Festuca glaucescens]
MDHTEALPRDVLTGVLGRLSPRDLAVSRCVRRAWCAIVDRRRLLLLRAEDLPHSVEGIYANYSGHERPQFLGRPSTQHPGVDYGNLHFPPHYTDGYMKIAALLENGATGPVRLDLFANRDQQGGTKG